jgi:hypothetical protein
MPPQDSDAVGGLGSGQLCYEVPCPRLRTYGLLLAYLM